ncbi:hypothetical protein BJX99DRAFT_248032 [Aspergillus californicus]
MSSYPDSQSRHSSVPPSAQPHRSLFGGSSQDVLNQERLLRGDDELLEYTEVGTTPSGGPNADYEESDDDQDYISRDKDTPEFHKDYDLLKYNAPHGKSASAGRRVAESSSSPPAYRPNRFQGPADLWLELTRDDREIAEALAETRARDLAAHLYNAHVLQSQNMRKLENRTAQSDESEAHDNNSNNTDLPSIVEEWMAWPMPSDEVPRIDERLRRLEDDKWTYRMKPDARPSGELEECVTAFLLKTAKDSHRLRSWGSPALLKREDSARTRTNGAKFGADVDLESDQGNTGDLSYPHDLQSNPDDGLPTAYWGNEEDLRDALRPVFQVDDDESRRKLRPLVRNVTTQFEHLLMGLDRFHGSSNSEDNLSRSRSRGRKRARSASQASNTSSAYSGSPPAEDGSKAERDAAMNNAVSNPPSSRKRRTKLTPDRSHSRGRRRQRRASQQSQQGSTYVGSAHTSRHSQLRNPSTSGDFQSGLTDWKDVVGIASMVDLPSVALQRAVQRVSALLGEDAVSDDPSRYFMADLLNGTPTKHDIAGSEHGESLSQPRPASQLPPSRATSTSPENRAGLKAADKGCHRHKKGFSRRWNLNLHLKTMHPSYRLNDNKSRTRSGMQSGYDSDRSE